MSIERQSRVNEAVHNATAPRSGIGIEPSYFSPAQYLLGVARHVMEVGQNALITLPDIGYVAIFPGERRFVAQVQDMAAFCSSPASAFVTSHLAREESARLADMRPTGNIKDLLWQAAFYASGGRLVESNAHGEPVHIYDVIRFHHWPNLTRLPMTPNTMRICALLTRQPSSIALIPKKLGITPEEVYQVYSAACASGILHVQSSGLGKVDDLVNLGDEDKHAHHRDGLLHSLLAKISGL